MLWNGIFGRRLVEGDGWKARGERQIHGRKARKGEEREGRKKGGRERWKYSPYLPGTITEKGRVCELTRCPTLPFCFQEMSSRRIRGADSDERGAGGEVDVLPSKAGEKKATMQRADSLWCVSR